MTCCLQKNSTQTETNSSNEIETFFRKRVASKLIALLSLQHSVNMERKDEFEFDVTVQ